MKRRTDCKTQMWVRGLNKLSTGTRELGLNKLGTEGFATEGFATEGPVNT
jgi:hypothetical protein